MKYKEASKILYSLINYERERAKYQDFKLERYKKFLAEISNPERQLKNVILVAGTKGKGSTSTMLASCLSACGIKTGLFTSPHLLSWRERIRIDGRMIATRNFTEIFSSLLPLIYKHKLTFFEVLTTIAFLYFIKEGVEYSVLEVGLGGRLDATNVVSPNLSIITRIGFDHTELLGNDLVSIAREKAGIIHPQGTVVTFAQIPEVLEVIKEVANKNECKLVVKNLINYPEIKLGKRGSFFQIEGEDLPFFLPLVGEHQIENAGIVIASLLEMQKACERITWEGVREGLKNVYLPARCEIISQKPEIMVDVAHNPDSCFALKNVIQKIYRKKAIFVFGVAKDKKVEEMLRILSEVGEYFIFTKARHPRALDVDIIASYAERLNLRFERESSISRAMRKAISRQGEEIIVITGSFYVVGEALQYLRRTNSQISIANG